MTYSLSLIFSSGGYNTDKYQPTIPTYITISPRKDGMTAKTKRLNPQRPHSTSSFSSPIKRKFKTSNLSSILPKFRAIERRPSSTYSSDTTILPNITRSSILSLPNEIISCVLYYLDYTSVHKFSRTCSKLYTICHDNDLWRRFLFADFQAIIGEKYRENYLKLYQNHLKLSQRWLTGKVTTRFLQGHQDSVYCLGWLSKDILLSGSRDKTLKMWHVPTNKCIQTIEHEHDGSILCIRVDQKNQLVMTGSSDTTCTLWNLPQMQPIMKLVGHQHNVLDVCLVNPKRIVTSSRDHTLRVWDRETGLELRQMVGHTASVNAMEPVDENRVVSASGDATLKLWNIETGECIRTMYGHKLGLACVKYSQGRVYSGGLEGKMKVWDIETGKCLQTMVGHAGMIRSIDCVNQKIVTGSYDRTLKVWDTETGACILSFQSGHSNWIFNVLSSGTRIISSGQEKRIMVLDFGTGLTPLCH